MQRFTSPNPLKRKALEDLKAGKLFKLFKREKEETPDAFDIPGPVNLYARRFRTASPITIKIEPKPEREISAPSFSNLTSLLEESKMSTLPSIDSAILHDELDQVLKQRKQSEEPEKMEDSKPSEQPKQSEEPEKMDDLKPFEHPEQPEQLKQFEEPEKLDNSKPFEHLEQIEQRKQSEESDELEDSKSSEHQEQSEQDEEAEHEEPLEEPLAEVNAPAATGTLGQTQEAGANRLLEDAKAQILDAFTQEGINTDIAHGGDLARVANAVAFSMTGLVRFMNQVRDCHFENYTRLNSDNADLKRDNQRLEAALRACNDERKRLEEEFLSLENDFHRFQKRSSQREILAQLRDVESSIDKLRAPDVTLQQMHETMADFDSKLRANDAKIDTFKHKCDKELEKVAAARQGINRDVKDYKAKRKADIRDLMAEVKTLSEQVDGIGGYSDYLGSETDRENQELKDALDEAVNKLDKVEHDVALVKQHVEAVTKDDEQQKLNGALSAGLRELKAQQIEIEQAIDKAVFSASNNIGKAMIKAADKATTSLGNSFDMAVYKANTSVDNNIVLLYSELATIKAQLRSQFKQFANAFE